MLQRATWALQSVESLFDRSFELVAVGVLNGEDVVQQLSHEIGLDHHSIGKVAKFALNVLAIYVGACYVSRSSVMSLGSNIVRFTSQSLLNKSVASLLILNHLHSDFRPDIFNGNGKVSKLNDNLNGLLGWYTIYCFFKGCAFWSIANNISIMSGLSMCSFEGCSIFLIQFFYASSIATTILGGVRFFS